MRSKPRPSDGFQHALRARLALGFGLLLLLAFSMGLTGLYYTGR